LIKRLNLGSPQCDASDELRRVHGVYLVKRSACVVRNADELTNGETRKNHAARRSASQPLQANSTVRGIGCLPLA
jgi:hypothetical protein